MSNVIPKGSLRKRLREGEFVLGSFLELPSPQTAEIMALAGLDFLVVDCEHGTMDASDVEHLIRAVQCAGASAMVRVAEIGTLTLRQPLDSGASGIQVPQLTSREEAESVVRGTTFPPLGERGIQPVVRGASYGAYPTAEYMQQVNEETLLVVQIESAAGVAALDEILQVQRIDVVFVGPFDLSVSLGLPGQVDHPQVLECAEEVIRKTLAAGKRAGIFCVTPNAVAHWRKRGVTYAVLSADTLLLRGACRDLMESVKHVAG